MTRPNVSSKKRCFRCGRTSHIEKHCQEILDYKGDVLDDLCYRCGRPGHWSDVCVHDTFSNGKPIAQECIIL